MSGVTTQHPEYIAALPIWRATRDAVVGEPAIKAGGELYLPAFVPEDEDRYSQYKKRAYFMGITGRTEKSLLGMVFRKAPVYEVPPQIEALFENIDGAGQSIEQVAKNSTRNIMEAGRHILFVDYPKAPEGMSAEDEARMGFRPVMASYPAESLINWRFAEVGGRQMLTLAVLVEAADDDNSDEFSHDTVVNYRVLRLRAEGYTQQRYDEKGHPIEEEYAPKMAGGAAFDHIPLHIIGADDNLPAVDMPPLYDMAVVNIAHYQTTADHRENLFIHGQMTLGITSDMSWQEFQSANPDGVKVGARTGHYLGSNGGFTSVSAPESSSLRGALTDLENQMVMIGARLVQRGGQAETAEAARLNASAEASTLDTIVSNASEGIEAALEDMALFLGVDPDSVLYRLNDNFWESSLSSQDLMAVTAARQAGIFDEREALHMIRTGALRLNADRSDDDILQGVAESLVDEPIDAGL
jgi:hypothetical protein